MRLILWAKKNALEIALIVVMVSVFIFLAATNYFYMSSPQTIAIQQAQAEAIQARSCEKDWKRLHKKHGYPGAVIYEPGKEPYYYCGNQKCKFI